MALSECSCGEPLYEYQLACPHCGASNEAYVSFGWGRRIAVVLAGVVAFRLADIVWRAVLGSEPIAEVCLGVGLAVAGGVLLVFRICDALRLRGIRRSLAARPGAR